jgi:hypothetical protein
VEQPRVEDADHAATAERRELARDVAAEPLGRLEAHEHDLQRADVTHVGDGTTVTPAPRTARRTGAR